MPVGLEGDSVEKSGKPICVISDLKENRRICPVIANNQLLRLPFNSILRDPGETLSKSRLQ